MTSPTYRPSRLQWQLFRGSEAVRREVLTPTQLRSGAWMRVRSDVYADARLERDHELACRAAALRLPTEATLAGPSAAYLDGVRHAARADDPVHVLVPTGHSFGPRQGLRVHEAHMLPGDVSVRGGLRRTSPARTAWDVAAWLDVVPAVAIVDGLLAGKLVDDALLGALLERRQGDRGWRRAQRVFDLADAAAQSPPESQLRVRLVLAGLPRPVAQHPVRLPSGLVLHPDLAWPAFRVALEYDGHWHADADQLHRDRQRLNQLATAGWTVLHVTSRRLHRDFPALLTEIRAALHLHGWR